MLFSHKSSREDQLDQEMRRHIEMETEANIKAGMKSVEARAAARRTFGNASLAAEDSRAVWKWLSLERLLQDLRYGVRGLLKTPSFTLAALGSLALGIGVSTAFFSVIYGVLIDPYPYAKPNEIWAPGLIAANKPLGGLPVLTKYEFSQLVTQPVLANVMATRPVNVQLSTDLGLENSYDVEMSGSAFNFLGVKPILGRTIQPFDITPSGDAQPVAVLTTTFWTRMFNASPDALGKKVIVNGIPHTVIGVMPPRFGWWNGETFWVPMPMKSLDEEVFPIVRLRPGVTKQIAEQQLGSLYLRLRSEAPGRYPKGALRSHLINYMDITAASGEMSNSLKLLMAAVGLLLLIACANVANLQLARMSSRAREMALRLSLGASRGRLIRQLLTESVLLALAGGALGVLLAAGATRWIAVIIPPGNVPNEARITLNVQVMLFCAAISVFTGILFGLAPALQFSRPNLGNSLKDGGKGTAGSKSGQRTRRLLVVAELTLSVVLLAGATIAMRTFTGLLAADPGFHPEKALLTGLRLPADRYATPMQRNRFAANLLNSLQNLPGVKAAAIGNGGFPFGGLRSAYVIPGIAPAEGRQVMVSLMSRDYLLALGILRRRGRTFTEAEETSAAHIALINESAAKLWPAGQDPIGRTISLEALTNPQLAKVSTNPGTKMTVVGIFADTKNVSMRQPTMPAICLPYTLMAPPGRNIAVRTQGEPAAMFNAVRERIQSFDKALPIDRPQTLKEILGFETVQPRFNFVLLALFASLGLALAAIGIYSVISYDVAQRKSEMGIRAALGASRAHVIRLVLRGASRLVIYGLLLGLVGSVGLERLVRSQIFTSSGLDAWAVVGVSLVLALVALIAAWWPASRAAGIDPIEALRHD